MNNNILKEFSYYDIDKTKLTPYNTKSINQLKIIIKMRKEFIFSALALSLMVTSCATIFSGSTQYVRFTSNPPAATIFIDEVVAGQTPAVLKLTRKNRHNVKMKLDGYQTYQTDLTQKFNAWTIGNVVLGGVIGLVVDVSTGAMYNLSPGAINISLNNGSTDELPMKVVQEITPKVKQSKDQLNVGDNVKFYSYRFNSNINGVVKRIKGETIMIEYESFGIMKTVEISKSDIKRI